MENYTKIIFSQDIPDIEETSQEDFNINEEFIDDTNPNSFDDDKQIDVNKDNYDDDIEGNDHFEDKDSNYIEKTRRIFNRNFCL